MNNMIDGALARTIKALQRWQNKRYLRRVLPLYTRYLRIVTPLTMTGEVNR